MNQYKQESNGVVAAAEPLFASVWLALFFELRKNYIERRSAKNSAESVDSASTHPQKKK